MGSVAAVGLATGEGSVGGGTGMICYEFKGGNGTASRVVDYCGTSYTVGVFLQANFGSREELSVRWHPLRTTSPNIGATVRVVAGRLSAADLVEAGLPLDPADPAGALATLLAEVQSDHDLGPQRRTLLGIPDLGGPPGT